MRKPVPDMCEPHATSSPPKPPLPDVPSSCHEDGDDDVEQAEPCEPMKPRVDGSPERCRQVWDEFCKKQDPEAFALNEEVAEVAASLAAATLPPVARAALEEQLSIAPGSLTTARVQIVRMRLHHTAAEVVVLDPEQRRMRSAYVPLIGSNELNDVARVLELLKSWEPAAETQRETAG